MAITLSTLLAAYMAQMQNDADENGLEIPHQLGRPIFGQTRPTLPLGVVLFEEDGYRSTPERMPRLGQTPPTGHELRAIHYVYARGEPELVVLADRMRTIRSAVAAVVCDNIAVTVRFSPTRRVENPTEERMLDFVVATELTFTWN
jgi:hypothetical protein